MIHRLDADGHYVKLDKPALHVLKEALDSKVSEKEVLQIQDEAAKSFGLRQAGILWKGVATRPWSSSILPARRSPIR
jgi:hypothetical protein